MRVSCCLLVVVVLAGCATRNGAYWYRADVSTEQARIDLAGCQFEAEKALAAYNTPGTAYARSAGDAMAKGFLAGLDVAARRDRVISTCMPAKGYALRQRGVEDDRIDRTIVAPPVAVAAPKATDPNAAPAIVQPARQVATNYEIPMAEAKMAGPTVSAIGEWTFGAERLAKSSSCADAPVARLTGKGPGLETFAVTCTNGDVMSVRCDYGQCRAMR